MPVEIALGNTELKALIDDEDLELVSAHKWKVHKGGNYVRAWTNGEGVRMHRLILSHHGYDITGFDVDHINRNPLDNRKCNLRVCTEHKHNIGNSWNPLNKSGYKGVSLNVSNRWVAAIKRDAVTYYLGVYKTPEEAAIVYNKAAREHFGEFALLNEVDESIVPKRLTERSRKKISDEQVLELKALHAKGNHSYQDLADIYKISRNLVWKIVTGRMRS